MQNRCSCCLTQICKTGSGAVQASNVPFIANGIDSKGTMICVFVVEQIFDVYPAKCEKTEKKET